MTPINTISISGQQLLQLAQIFAEEAGTCLLYSGGDHPASKHSFLSLFPFEFVVIREKKQRHWKKGDKVGGQVLALPNPWDGLKALLQLEDSDDTSPKWVGFIGYEMGTYAEPDVLLSYSSSATPDAYFHRSTLQVKFDHTTKNATLYADEEGLLSLSKSEKEWVDKLSNPQFWNELENNLPKLEHLQPTLKISHPLDSREEYCKKVMRAKEKIFEGEIYQVNLSQKLSLKGKCSPFSLFSQLVQINPAPFSAYLHTDSFTIVSSSPERFLKKEEKKLESRPIKGTIQRGKNPQEDQEFKELLMKSPKEKAELLMITDLMRNDLARVSLPGSVVTKQLWSCEAYTNVFHLVSVLESRVNPTLSPVEVIRSCFPGGSITGCPKLRAMEIIHSLEKSPRGVYTGSIGYISYNGDFDFNIAIRTLVIAEDHVEVRLGGGIVAESVPEQEYEETLHKGASLFKSLGVEEKRL